MLTPSDSADVEGATLWSDDTNTGLGQAVGIVNEDFHVGTGGFASNFTLAYPATHPLRRNFTLEPWATFAGSSYVPEPYRDANATFTPAAIAGIIANNTGDFKGFQAAIEYFEGPHGAVHEILGGDLAGYCPENANEACFENEPSPTFSANEPLFWLHHGVRSLPVLSPPTFNLGMND
jgi:tyrosinase